MSTEDLKGDEDGKQKFKSRYVCPFLPGLEKHLEEQEKKINKKL